MKTLKLLIKTSFFNEINDFMCFNSSDDDHDVIVSSSDDDDDGDEVDDEGNYSNSVCLSVSHRDFGELFISNYESSFVLTKLTVRENATTSRTCYRLGSGAATPVLTGDHVGSCQDDLFLCQSCKNSLRVGTSVGCLGYATKRPMEKYFHGSRSTADQIFRSFISASHLLRLSTVYIENSSTVVLDHTVNIDVGSCVVCSGYATKRPIRACKLAATS